jgi:DNA-directed RNA polymerase subunit RPC12/RpoP
MSWRCPECDADLSKVVEEGQKAGIRCPNCHSTVDAKKRKYRVRRIEVDEKEFRMKVYRQRMQVGKGYYLDGIVEFRGETVLQSTLSDENEEKLVSLMQNAIRTRMKGNMKS